MSRHFRFDASRSLIALEQDSAIIAVIEMAAALDGGKERLGGIWRGCLGDRIRRQAARRPQPFSLRMTPF